MIGWAPHKDQPKPMRRGSAKFSMKDLEKEPSDVSDSNPNKDKH